MIDHVELIGLIAAILTTSSFLPQVYKTWKTKDVSGLSLTMLLLFFIGVVLWLLYGILIKSFSIILANTITAISGIFLIYFKLKYRKYFF